MAAASAVRALLGSWAFEGLGWFSLREAAMRVVLEGGLVLGLLVLGLGLLVLTIAWLLAHTVFWFFLYGGFEKIGSLSGRETDIPTLVAFQNEIVRRVQTTPSFRAAVLCGSAARGELNTHSDIDIVVVPGSPFPRAILTLWALRASAVIRRLPLGAATVDLDRCLPFRTIGEQTITLKLGSASPKSRFADGAFVSFSGIDGSGKTAVARRLVDRLRSSGVTARYFYGHRPFYREGKLTLSGALLFKGVWHRVGRSPEDLRRYPRLTLALGLLTLLDYVVVQLRLSRVLWPGAVVLVDRYVADVIVYLRAFGVRRQSVEGLLTAVSIQPAVGLLFEIDPTLAHSRKAEESVEALDRHAREYESLAPLLGLTSIDASGSMDTVCDRALAEIRRAVDVAIA